jgi:hypothetical protein
MSSIKFYTNRQIALKMAIKRSSQQNSTDTIIKEADVFYKWLQDAPQKDADQPKLNL